MIRALALACLVAGCTNACLLVYPQAGADNRYGVVWSLGLNANVAWPCDFAAPPGEDDEGEEE